MNERRTHIDLFSGIGGFALASNAAGFSTSVFCESDPYATRVLKRHWPTVPIIKDIREFDGTRWGGADLLTGGFPCQPFSQAGERRGEEDDRHLWPEMFRVIKEARPDFVLAENVAGLINMALDDVLSELEGEGYTTGTVVIPACSLNAPHRRDRVWILAHSDPDSIGHMEREHGKHPAEGGIHAQCGTLGLCEDVAHADIAGLEGSVFRKEPEKEVSEPAAGCGEKVMADTEGKRCGKRKQKQEGQQGPVKGSSATPAPLADPPGIRQSGQGEHEQRSDQAACGERETDNAFPVSVAHQWSIEPNVGRVAHGIPKRVDRLKALGNAIVPQVAYEILKLI